MIFCMLQSATSLFVLHKPTSFFIDKNHVAVPTTNPTSFFLSRTIMTLFLPQISLPSFWLKVPCFFRHKSHVVVTVANQLVVLLVSLCNFLRARHLLSYSPRSASPFFKTQSSASFLLPQLFFLPQILRPCL